MHILFNELSLTGQFHDIDAFLKNGLRPLLGVLKEMQGFSTQKFPISMLKKNDNWDRPATPTNNLHSILIDVARRKSDEVRKLKTAIADLFKEPFWDSDGKQGADTTYFFDGVDIRGSSPAEACERDKAVVSFVSSPASSDPLDIIRNGKSVPLVNLTCSGRLREVLLADKQISFESYLKARFSGGRLDFSKADKKMGFPKMTDEAQSLFIGTFEKFEKLT